MNYYNGATEKRGYYVSARVVEVKQCDGYSMESFMMFGGLKMLLLEVNRQGAKALEKAVALAESVDLSELKQKVLSNPSNL
jgi:hypothetical protein